MGLDPCKEGEVMMRFHKIHFLLTGAALTLILTACGDNQQGAQKTTAPASQPAAQAPVATPAATSGIKGKVVEVMDASGYTYVKIDDGSEQGVWAAIPKAQLEVGEEITLQGGSMMNNFSSKTLDRTFEEIIFASGVVRGGSNTAVSAAPSGGSFSAAVQAEGTGQDALPSSGGSTGQVVAFSELKVEKSVAENGYTVGEVFEKATDLDKKTISINGQVVKVSRNIMGKNWLHIQDGTGDPVKNTHDLVVTTLDLAEKGEIITFNGTLTANKDFGSGYKYNVIVEDGSIVKK